MNRPAFYAVMFHLSAATGLWMSDGAYVMAVASLACACLVAYEQTEGER